MQLTVYGEAALVLENREGAVKIPFQGIEYVEVFNKTVSFHMADGGVHEETAALTDFEEALLERPEFAKSHRSYIVNLGCIQAIEGGFAVTKGGRRVPVSRQRRAPVREAWLQFMQQEGEPQADSAAFRGQKRPEGPWRILLVDDDPAERALWADVLRTHGCAVYPAENGGQALALAEKEQFDCILLDVMIPGEDGFSICGRLRERLCAPVIFLSSVTESDRQMEGFAAGGIDYITKDTPAGLFWTKVRTRITLASSERTQACYGPLLLDLAKRKAYVDEKELALEPAGFDILWLLSEHAGQVLSPEEISRAVWGGESQDGGERVLRAMSRLRRALERACAHRFVEAVWGEGYRFIPPDAGRVL